MKTLDDVLSHYGVPGMRWGVRKRSSVPKATSPEAVKLRIEPGTKVKAIGGRGYPPSADAKAAVAYKQIAKSSSSHALTNKQLEAVVKRMKLEQEWAKIAQADREASKSVGRRLFDKFKAQEVNKIQQGKTPQTILLAQAINGALSGTGGKHRKK